MGIVLSSAARGRALWLGAGRVLRPGDARTVRRRCGAGNSALPLSDNAPLRGRLSLYVAARLPMVIGMKRIALLPAVALALALLPGIAAAACYADYKAKQDNPLRLHYGVIEVPDRACTPAAARDVIARRIGRDGWQLLTVLGTFGDEGLEERRESAGAYFLRY